MRGSFTSSCSGDTSLTSGGVSFATVIVAVSTVLVNPFASHTTELHPPCRSFTRSNEKSSLPSDSTPATTTSPGSLASPSIPARAGLTEILTFEPSSPTTAAVFV